MFSDRIQSLVNSSNASSATERAAQIEGMLAKYNPAVQTLSPPTETSKIPAFSDYMKMAPATNVKYRIVPPTQAFSKDYITNLISDLSGKHGVDEKLIQAIVKHESNFNPNAKSSAGAAGLMQLMPQTARSYGVSNPFDPSQNLEAGIKLIKGLLGKYNGNVVLALSAYNAGSGNVAKYGGVPPFKETQGYIKKILHDYLG